MEVGRVLSHVVVMRVGMGITLVFRTKFFFLIPLKCYALGPTPEVYRKIKNTEAECCGGCYRGQRRELNFFFFWDGGSERIGKLINWIQM